MLCGCKFSECFDMCSSIAVPHRDTPCSTAFATCLLHRIISYCAIRPASTALNQTPNNSLLATQHQQVIIGYILIYLRLNVVLPHGNASSLHHHAFACLSATKQSIFKPYQTPTPPSILRPALCRFFLRNPLQITISVALHIFRKIK